jgi:hypothetical protein
MAYKSRSCWAMGQRVSEEDWDLIFKGDSNESEIGHNKRVSASDSDVLGEKRECKETQGPGEGNIHTEWKACPTASKSP